MKSKILILSVIISSLSLVFLSSCDNHDNVVNNNNTNTVLYTQDSISLLMSPPGNQTGTDSAVYSANPGNVSRVKLEFQIETNADSTMQHAIATFYVLSNGTPALPSETTIYTSTAASFSYILDINTSQTFYVIFHLGMTTGTISIPYYIRFRNVKITSQ